MATQLQEGLAWGELRGIKAFVADSNYNGTSELIVFAHTDGYVYRMEDGNSFDGSNIISTFATPFFPITDPRVRKSFYKMFLFTDPQGSFNSNFSLKYDFADPSVIQPATKTISNTAVASEQAIYGNVQFAHGGLVNNGSNYSSGVTTIAVDNLSTSNLIAGDTFIIAGQGTGSGASFVHTVFTLSSAPSITNNAGNLTFSPATPSSLNDNTKVSFKTVNSVGASTYGGESLKSIFEEQTTGSGFTASLQFESESTDAPYSLDAVTLEYIRTYTLIGFIMTGYTRTDTTNNIADGNIINASDFDGEFDAIETAFGTSGHTHDGVTAGDGGAITKIGPGQDLVVSTTQVVPKTTEQLTIGTSSLKFTDLHLNGSINATGLATDILVATDKKIQFHDTAIFIHASQNGQLDIDADTTVQINTATLDIDASSEVNISGATTIGGIITATTGTHSLGATSFNDNAITNVGDIQLDSITGDDDTDTSITFSGSNIITIATGGSNRLTIADGALSPVTTNQIDLGTSSLEYKNAFFDGTVTTDALVADTADIDAGTIDGVTLGTNSAITQAVIDNVNINGAQIGHTDDTDLITLADQAVTIAGSLTLSGGLTVNGTTTTVATTNTVVSDSLIELANGTSGSPSNDAGIVIERGSANNAFMGFDESADKFIVGTGTFTGASTGDLTITTGTLVANLEGNVSGATTIEGTTLVGKIKNTGGNDAFTLPDDDGSADQFLKTDGSGNLDFASVSNNSVRYVRSRWCIWYIRCC